MTHPREFRNAADVVYMFDQCTPPVFCVFVTDATRLFMDDKIECQIERNGWAVIMGGKVYAQGIERHDETQSRGPWFEALDVASELAQTQSEVNRAEQENRALIAKQERLRVGHA